MALLVLSMLSMAFSSPAKAPEVSFSTLDGKTYYFSDFKGKVVLVNFFASYCPPCMVELNELAKLYKKYQDDGLVVVSLMVDEEGRALLPQIVEAKGITYPVGVATEEVLKAFGDPPITPTTFIINKEGVVVKRLLGYTGRKYLERKIKEYLTE
ncbi:MAG TPA: TlpA family protein disulfide reductase [Thermodesulfobacteriaceae bacterium]|nr:TlpA family protein disulfide reductase [Thermodesulfobacteriaceae bacterium]